MSSIGALNKSGELEEEEYGNLVAKLLESYNPENQADVLSCLKDLCEQKKSLLQSLSSWYYETSRLGLNPKKQKKVQGAIIESSKEILNLLEESGE